jgi:tRNA(Ile)-lysidine synthase
VVPWRSGYRYRQLLYHFFVQDLAQRLLQTIRKQESIRPGDRVAVAVSGGADSVALLHLFLELQAELGIVLSVVHVNHKLRGAESDEDQRFVAELAQKHGLELHACQAPIEQKTFNAKGKSSGIEASTRELRYSFFRQIASAGFVTKIATAHTLDDQAETVLLRIFRGTGIRGLAGIHPRIVFEEQGRVCGEVVRPVLGFRREALQGFVRDGGHLWREDSSNSDVAFLRNRVRHRLLPLIAEEFGEAAIEHMGELAEIARGEEEHWKTGHSELQQFGTGETRQAASLQIGAMLGLPLAAQRRLVREWLDAHAHDSRTSFRLIEGVLELSRDVPGKRMEVPGDEDVRRGNQDLFLESRAGEVNRDYEYTLPIPGMVQVPELRGCIEARVLNVHEVPEKDRGQLLDRHRIPSELAIRNWRPGDRYWPAHTAAARKVKELLSDRHATGTEKKLWPVAVAERCGLVWMRGFAVPAAFGVPATASQAVWISERQA